MRFKRAALQYTNAYANDFNFREKGSLAPLFIHQASNQAVSTWQWTLQTNPPNPNNLPILGSDVRIEER
jgi:hypothetical protein